MKEMERRYAAPSIFERRCPHAVAVLYDRIGEAMGEGRVGEALDLAGEIRRMDPANPMHALGKARILLASCRCGESEGARLLGDEALKKTQPLAVYSLAGDIAWAAGDTGRAEQYYEAALESAFDDYNRRLLQIKLWAARQGGELSLLLRKYFICSEGSLFESSFSRVALLLLMKEKFPNIPLIPYLLGRNLFNEGCYEAAAACLEEALSLSEERPGVPMPRKEALLLLGSCAVNLPGGEEKAREVTWKLEREKDLSPAESFRMGELKEYLEFVAGSPPGCSAGP
jgi:tetratricopeptide (TPR) repeat protein